MNGLKGFNLNTIDYKGDCNMHILWEDKLDGLKHY